jgi:hypothetical protein
MPYSSHAKNLEYHKAYYQKNRTVALADAKVYRDRNKERIALQIKEWKERNKKHSAEWRKAYIDRGNRNRRLKKYGLTDAQYNQLLLDQDGRCAICFDDESTLHVDHCHKTNKVRALLCGNCNRALGLVRDSPVILKRMVDFIGTSLAA